MRPAAPLSPAAQAAPRAEYDFTSFDADDSGSMTHEVVPPTDDEDEAEMDALFASITTPRFKREARS